MCSCFFFFFFNDTATTEIYTLSLHDALPISGRRCCQGSPRSARATPTPVGRRRCATTRCTRHHRSRSRQDRPAHPAPRRAGSRSEEHTSELQSRQYLVCRLLLEKKKQNSYSP